MIRKTLLGTVCALALMSTGAKAQNLVQPMLLGFAGNQCNGGENVVGSWNYSTGLNIVGAYLHVFQDGQYLNAYGFDASVAAGNDTSLVNYDLAGKQTVLGVTGLAEIIGSHSLVQQPGAAGVTYASDNQRSFQPNFMTVHSLKLYTSCTQGVRNDLFLIIYYLANPDGTPAAVQ